MTKSQALGKSGVSLLLATLVTSTFALGMIYPTYAQANPLICADLMDSRLADMSFKKLEGGKTLRLDWAEHIDSMRNKLKKLGIDEKAVHFRVVRNGDRLPEVFDFNTRTFDMPMPKVQTDFYVELEYGTPAKTIYRSYVMIKEDLLGGQTVKASSFSGILKNSALKISVPDSVKSKGYTGKITDVAFEEGYKKISYVLRTGADPKVRQLLEESAGTVEVEVKMNKEGEPTGVTLSDKNSGKTLLEASPKDFYFKLDAAFSGNSFFWDDMFVSLSTVSSHPWLVRSTIEFWLDVQAANNGVIPREVRKGNLKSLFFPDVIALGEDAKPNLTYTNPYLIDWAADELYTHNPSPENLALLKRVSTSIDDYSKWMYENRSVKDANGTWMGFTTNSLASGLDNSRGERGNNFAKDSYNSAWVDVLAQQIAMFKSSAKFNARFAADKSVSPSDRARYAAKAKAMSDKATALDQHLNKYHWNSDLGFYFDLIPDGKGGYKQDTKYYSVAGFWPLYAQSVSPDQMKKLISKQMTPEHFGGAFPLPANSRHTLVGTDPGEDGYWDIRGHWPSMAAVVIEGFSRSGQSKLASELALRFSRGMEEANPNTVAEFYGEYNDAQGNMHARVGVHGHHQTRLAFAGWGRLVIYYSSRFVMGLQPQADGSLRWDAENLPSVGTSMGVDDYQFHGEKMSIQMRADAKGQYSIMTSSKTPVEVEVVIDGKKLRVTSGPQWTQIKLSSFAKAS